MKVTIFLLGLLFLIGCYNMPTYKPVSAVNIPKPVPTVAPPKQQYDSRLSVYQNMFNMLTPEQKREAAVLLYLPNDRIPEEERRRRLQGLLLQDEDRRLQENKLADMQRRLDESEREMDDLKSLNRRRDKSNRIQHLQKEIDEVIALNQQPLYIFHDFNDISGLYPVKSRRLGYDLYDDIGFYRGSVPSMSLNPILRRRLDDSCSDEN